MIALRDTPSTPSSAAIDALRTLACVLTAGFVAGLLVVGFGGRLVMRVLAATSGVSDPLAVAATVYVVARAILHGRLAPTIESSPLRLAGCAVVVISAIAAASAVYAALTHIV